MRRRAWAARREQPPLARGRLVQGLGEDLGSGTTPAGAGTTPRSGRREGRRRNNPRWRGDDPVEGEGSTRPREQPPLARGRPVGRQRHPVVRGTTPAGAGTTGTTARSGAARTNNPRWRGDDSPLLIPNSRRREQPPLARGRHYPSVSDTSRLRTTPAGAGTTKRAGTDRVGGENNPRWRGDDGPTPWARPPHGEQPPLARGRQRRGDAARDAAGTTPAGAGTTCHRPDTPYHHPNNPRWRGDDEKIAMGIVGIAEQPPLARGRLEPGGRPGRVCRTTPAGAGTTT